MERRCVLQSLITNPHSSRRVAQDYTAHETAIYRNPPATQFYRRQKSLNRQAILLLQTLTESVFVTKLSSNVETFRRIVWVTTNFRFLSVMCMYMLTCLLIYRVSQEECARFREGVPYVKVYRYNPKHLCPKSNGYGDNCQRKVWSSCASTHCTCQLTMLFISVLECGAILLQVSSH